MPCVILRYVKEMHGLTFGIIGGLGSLAGADLFLKLVRHRKVMANQDRYHFHFEQHPFRDAAMPLTREANMTTRKLYVFRRCQSFEEDPTDILAKRCVRLAQLP